MSLDHSLEQVAQFLPHSTHEQCPHFEIFRVARTRLTTILFSGGDWRWILMSPSGGALASGDGYKTEASCRVAVNFLKQFGGSAKIVSTATST